MTVKEKLPYTDHKMKVNGLRIHYTDWGNPHLPHLFLAHGGVANAYFWNLVAPTLRDSFHVVAVTARGRGKSEYSTEGKYDYDKDYVQDFRELTTRLGMDRLFYIGQSMGGRIGMSYAGTYPEQVERLILVDIGAEVSVRFAKGDPVTGPSRSIQYFCGGRGLAATVRPVRENRQRCDGPCAQDQPSRSLSTDSWPRLLTASS